MRGKVCSDTTVVTLDGEVKSLNRAYFPENPSMPIILNMGSYTWPPFTGNVDMMVDIFQNYCMGSNAVARFLTIYIDEAHASDEW